MTVLNRALEPFAVTLRTLDAVYMATLLFLQAQVQKVQLATYDGRMAQVARKLLVPLVSL